MLIVLLSSIQKSLMRLRYNNRAKEWVENGLETFEGQEFKLNDKFMSENREKSGEYYPVRDSCDKDGDPAEKCILTDALFYQGLISVTVYDSYVSVVIMNNSSSVVGEQYPLSKTSYLSRSALGCTDEEYYFLYFFLLVMIALLTVNVKVVFGIIGINNVL